MRRPNPNLALVIFAALTLALVAFALYGCATQVHQDAQAPPDEPMPTFHFQPSK